MSDRFAVGLLHLAINARCVRAGRCYPLRLRCGRLGRRGHHWRSFDETLTQCVDFLDEIRQGTVVAFTNFHAHPFELGVDRAAVNLGLERHVGQLIGNFLLTTGPFEK